MAHPARSGITLVETVISTVIVGVMLSAALSAAGAARTQRVTIAHHTQAMLLGEQLISEIQGVAYADPDGSTALGLDGESGATRAAFDDVDDYDSWTATPPVHADGTPVGGSTAFTRTVRVRWVDPADLATSRGTETGVKAIRVRVKLGDTLLAELISYRTEAGVPAVTGGG